MVPVNEQDTPFVQIVLGAVLIVLGAVMFLRRHRLQTGAESRLASAIPQSSFWKRVFLIDVFVIGPLFLIAGGIASLIVGMLRLV